MTTETDGPSVTINAVKPMVERLESIPVKEVQGLSNKSEELIRRYALAVAIQQAAIDGPEKPRPVVRAIKVDSPHVVPKQVLLATIAAHYGVEAFRTEKNETSLVGYVSDINAVELLYSSLWSQALIKAEEEMPANCTHGEAKSFRSAFLYGFAGAVNNRLASENTKIHKEHPMILGVLQGRGAEVEKMVALTFPRVTHTKVSIANEQGFGAGQKAARSKAARARRAAAEKRHLRSVSG